MAEVVDLNVGGVMYSTTLETLTKAGESLLAEMFSPHERSRMVKDSKGRYFIDRDGVLFRYILDFLRNSEMILPENFQEMSRLQQEATYFRLTKLCQLILDQSPNSLVRQMNCDSGTLPGFITIGYRGTFAFGRDGLADVQFRKLARIIVCGRVNLCREVFKETLNESRDPDRGASDRYTARYFLKHAFLEQAFDMLAEAGFKLVSSCGSGTNNAGEQKPGTDVEEVRWRHYNEFVFERQ